jgi:alcohol dehydrogenase
MLLMPTISAPKYSMIFTRRKYMKALVYVGPGIHSFDDCPKPTITDPTDAIIKITKTTICGSDLHILKGDVSSAKPGIILGHEGTGIIDEIGKSVTTFKIGDRVIISCISSCSKCEYCRKGMYSHCIHGGWILGNTINGTQAEYVRIPHADTSLYKLPEGIDEETCVMLSDILPTGYECGVINGKIQPGNTIALIGAGPVGLATLLTAQLFSPAEIIVVDIADDRLEFAKKFGATMIINNSDGKAAEKIMQVTNGRGVDTAIEAVGIPETFILCESILSPGGTIANIGLHGKKVALHLERLWSQNISITTRLVDTISTPMLIKAVEAKKINPKLLISHHFKLENILDAYATFGHATGMRALKVIINV